MRRIFIALMLLGLFFATGAFAQTQGSQDTAQVGNVDKKILKYEELESLPIELTPEEMTRLNEIGITHKTTSPPQGPARNPAEWEPMTGAIIRWTCHPMRLSTALSRFLSPPTFMGMLSPGGG